MAQEAQHLLDTLARIVTIHQYPFFPYDLYRYFVLLENLERQKKLNFSVDSASAYPADSFSALSYSQIRDRDWTGTAHAGTFQSRSMRQIMQFVDEEARHAAQALIAQQTWGGGLQMMKSFISYNDFALHLHIRNVPIMVCAVFLFLSVRQNPNRVLIITRLNSLLKEYQKKGAKKPKEEKEKEQEQKAPAPVNWGKTDKDGAFRIVRVTGSSLTPGAKCSNKTVKQLQQILYDEGFSKKEINRVSLLGRRKQNLCKLLQDHLKKQQRYL